MRTIEHRKGIHKYKIELYENIDEMPIKNFAQLEKNLIIESEVGASIGDFDVRFEKLEQFIASNKHQKQALNELNNMRNLFYNITHDVRPDTDGFSCLVHSINGEETLCTESGINKTTAFLNKVGITKKLVDERGEAKKKMNEQLRSSFPKLFDGDKIDLIGAQFRKLNAWLDEIIDDTEYVDKIQMENMIVSNNLRSKKFGNNEGEDVIYIKKFARMCISIQAGCGIDPKGMTVYDFYALVDHQKAA